MTKYRQVPKPKLKNNLLADLPGLPYIGVKDK